MLAEAVEVLGEQFFTEYHGLRRRSQTSVASLEEKTKANQITKLKELSGS